MVEIAIVYHSGYGHTAKQAEWVAKGVEEVAGSKAHVINADQADTSWDLLEKVDGIIFGAPTYMGSASAPFKVFMDKTSKLWLKQQWKDKLAAGFTNSGSRSGDKETTLTQLAVFAAQHGMIWISLGLLPGNNSSQGSEEDMNRLGSSLGAMAQSNVDEGPERGPSESDLKTAAHLGKRVAEVAHRWVKGRS
ncbi:MAG: flavodoxin family protein [Alphaproteobacteria bacterium]|nr:flavodoxin family protein [Alphaproteobacteria bacterium]OJV45349.1 MAG: NADPH-dependent FMN reductase [Alphaproteobacteria bacterium 43-37]